MTPAITRRGWIRILIITIVGIAILPFTPGVRQSRNLHLAAAYADKLRPVLRDDVRFKHITIGAFTGAGGSLMVHGEVEDYEDKDELTKVIVASKPPVQVIYMRLYRM